MSKWWRTAVVALRKTAETSRSYHTIQAIPREISGNRVSVKDRAQGRIPAVVFAQPNPSTGGGGTPPRPVSRKHLLTTEKRQIQSILNSIELPYFCSTTFPLQIRAGSGSSTLLESGNVLPIKVHRDSETGKLLNLVFVWADEGTELKVDVPIVFKGEDICPGLKKGGFLNKIRTSLKYKCPSEHIPQKIEIDISNLDIGDKVFMKEVNVHSSLELLSKNESLPICKIVAAKIDSMKPTQ
ncbi:uncharacterized protein LOC111891468 [Lactuca sativa]|uniref:Large ribosomal subunit protein bL25 beta domain-containing protein n=2 Tax=Lactuca TaxID=4235 RepID=A0AA35YZ73_LACSI|nr:uncharacterized protein LOC111891468 [Lactuca sativa]KAJ0209026.1 hypothetical protein LSAT_V11C400221570 [Lactuca sativa]CAI9282995.1 unnamed protein product [Lactuca saligna]